MKQPVQIKRLSDGYSVGFRDDDMTWIEVSYFDGIENRSLAIAECLSLRESRSTLEAAERAWARKGGA